MNGHLLSLLVALPAFGAAAVLFAPRQTPGVLKGIGILTALATFLVSLKLVPGSLAASEMRFVENVPWIESLGISWHLGVDGLSFWLILLTTLVTPLALIASLAAV